MNTEKKLSSKILKLIETINVEHPGLKEYIGQMPALIPNPKCPDTNIRSLLEYYDRLDLLLKNYLFKPKDLPGAATPLVYPGVHRGSDKKLNRSFHAEPCLSPFAESQSGPTEILFT
jgi:hypothetical protein